MSSTTSMRKKLDNVVVVSVADQKKPTKKRKGLQNRRVGNPGQRLNVKEAGAPPKPNQA